MITLDTIVTHKRLEVEQRKKHTPLSSLQEAITKLPTNTERDFIGALRRADTSPAVIAEFKKASPSAGAIAESADLEPTVQAYAAGGAAALSILTDEKFFHGQLDYISQAKEVVTLPVLRKDFIIDPYQVYESKVTGADAILLIVSVLEPQQLKTLSDLARNLGLQTLIEVHNVNELVVALSCDPQLIGINTRNLRTMEVDLQIFADIAQAVPDTTLLVAESSIATREDVTFVTTHGADAILVGTALMKAGDPAAAIKRLCK